MVISTKIFLTGATGLLGYNILSSLSVKNYQVVATFHETSLKTHFDNVSWIRVDLGDESEIVDSIKSTRPDIIIHAAAYTDVDGCEIHKEKAFRLNYLATKAIAHSAVKINAYLVYISTDYVFDGSRGLYRENDIPNPVNYYGLTKLLGETAVLSTLPESSLVVRTSGLYGYSPTGKKNFGINALEKLTRGEQVYAFYDQYLSPTYVYFLAELLIRAVEEKATGILNLAGERLSRYEFALRLSKVLKVEEILVKPISINDVKLVAKRPKDSSLDTSRAVDKGLKLPSTIDCLNHFVNTYLNKGVRDAV